MKIKLSKNVKIGLGAVTAIALLILLIPGLLSSIGALITGQVSNCDDTPYAANCFCEEDEDKLSVSAFGVPKYVCETSNKFIDPDGISWEAESIAYAQTVLQEAYPECNMNTCSKGQWVTAFGWEDYVKRTIAVECIVIDQRFAEVEFNVSDGTVTKSACGNYEPLPIGQPVIDFEYVGEFAYNGGKMFYDVRCNLGTGTATGSTVYTIPAEKPSATTWWFHGDGDTSIQIPYSTATDGTCNITDTTARTAKIECTAECASYGSYGGELYIRYS